MIYVDLNSKFENRKEKVILPWHFLAFLLLCLSEFLLCFDFLPHLNLSRSQHNMEFMILSYNIIKQQQHQKYLLNS